MLSNFFFIIFFIWNFTGLFLFFFHNFSKLPLFFILDGNWTAPATSTFGSRNEVATRFRFHRRQKSPMSTCSRKIILVSAFFYFGVFFFWKFKNHFFFLFQKFQKISKNSEKYSTSQAYSKKMFFNLICSNIAFVNWNFFLFLKSLKFTDFLIF